MSRSSNSLDIVFAIVDPAGVFEVMRTDGKEVLRTCETIGLVRMDAKTTKPASAALVSKQTQP
jgi:hypothetical protein